MATINLLSKIVTDDATFSGGAWVPSLPSSNLQDVHPKNVARTVDLAGVSTTFVVDMGVATPLQLFAFINTNFTSSGQFRVRAGPNADGSSALIDSGVAGVAALSPGSANRPPGGWITYFKNATAQSCRYVLVNIDESGNPDGYVEIGRFLGGVPFVPAINAAVGLSLGIIDDSQESRAVAGDRFVDVRPRRRLVKGVLDFLSETESLGAASVYDIIEAGIANPILALIDPDDSPTLKSRRTIYGALSSPDPITYARNGDVPYSWPFTIEEWT